MKSVKTLIDLAATRCGSDAELARRIGVQRSIIAEMRSGARAISPEAVVLMCDVLELPGEECQEWVAISLIENPKNASRVEVLKRALFACWVLGVGSLFTLFIGAPGTAWSAERTPIATHATRQGYNLLTDRSIIVADAISRAMRRLLALMARGILRATTQTGARDHHPKPTAIAAAGYLV